MSNKFSKVKSGFSLIELMVVMLIVIVMTAVLFAKNTGNRAKSDVDGASREMAARIRSMQNEALSGKILDTDNDGTFDTNSCGFNFQIIDANSYKTFYYNCLGVALVPGQIITDLTKKRIKMITDDVWFYFSPPRGDVKPVGPPLGSTSFSVAGNISLHLQSEDGSVNRYICISKSGSVTEQTAVCP